MLELMLRMVLVGALATAAAVLFEHALAHLRVGTRHAWTFAIAITALLPLIPEFLRAPLPAVVPQLTAPALVITASDQLNSNYPINILLPVWLALSALVAAYYLIAFVRLARARRNWAPARLAEQDVFVSREFGPAVFGFTRPRIVVPEWVRATSQEEQELILLHERQHIEARDHWQLVLTIAATIALPWHPFVWLQARRLRFRVETDCDQRVLNAKPDAAKYAALLVDVGSRQNGLLLMPALAEHRNGLERRLTMLVNRLNANRWKAFGLVAVGMVVTFAACEARLPSDALDTQPQRTKSADFIGQEYPRGLRSAGIGGTVGISVHVTDGGKADRVEVTRSSGHPELDAAAIRVAKRYEWGHAGPNKETSYWTRTTITFSPNPEPANANPSKLQLKRINPADGPQQMPYDVKPEVTNREEVGAILNSYYPPLLRDAGIGGTTIGWVLVDHNGNVMRTQLKRSSGRSELDAAALKVLEKIEFKPAEFRGMRVPVWIALPIVFRAE